MGPPRGGPEGLGVSGPHLIIGVDPGVSTGMATWCTLQARLIDVRTTSIVAAMEEVRGHAGRGTLLQLVVEDARARRGGFDRADAAQERSGAGIREGVGSVKRDCSVWQEFAEHHGIRLQFVPPSQTATKLGADEFARVSGWQGRTSVHGRDAAMLVLCQLGRYTRARGLQAPRATPAAPAAGPERDGERCGVCGYARGQHLPGFLRCPAGTPGAGAFARFGITRFTPECASAPG